MAGLLSAIDPRPIRWRAAAPPVAVFAAGVAAWLITGTSISVVALFLGHEIGFVVVPGSLVYAGLRRRHGCLLELVAMGYAVGSVLEVMAFALTAALDARGALWAYPPSAAVIGVALIRTRGTRHGTSKVSAPTAAWGGLAAAACAVTCVAAIAYITVAYFLFEPLPSHAGSVVYIPDLVFHLGVAAEALHHWPITDPKVAGVALPYETFVYMKLAAVSQITHIPLPTVLFRLYILPLILAAITLFAVLGHLVSGRRGVGVAAAALFVFVGQLGLDPHDQLVFANTVFFSLYDSPSYVCGLVLFLSALIVLVKQLRCERPTVRGWLLLGLLWLGCADAKAAILPILIGGLALYLGYRRVHGWQRRDRAAIVALLIASVVFIVTYFAIYHAESGGLHLRAPGSVRAMSLVLAAEKPVADALGRPVFWLLASAVGLIGFAGATLLGLPLSRHSDRIRRSHVGALLLAILVASLVPFFLLTHKGNSQNFFTYYGVCAACVLSAQGLFVAWGRSQPLPSRGVWWLSGFGVLWLLVLVAVAVLPNELRDPPPIGVLYALWMVLPLVTVVLLLGGAHRAGEWKGTLRLAALVAVLAVGALDTPLHTGSFIVSALRRGNTLYAHDSPQARGLTPGLQEALAWIRDNVPTSAVIAVNNQFSQSGNLTPDYYYYSAFGERRVFLEGWLDTVPAAQSKNPFVSPFPQRLRLNLAVFQDANPEALRTMETRFGVRYLLVDRVHGPSNPALARRARTVFSDPQAIIYAVGSP